MKQEEALSKISSEQRKAITNLLAKSEIGRDCIGLDVRNNQKYSNCHGTTAFILRLENPLLKIASRDAYFRDSEIFLANSRPGYVMGGLIADLINKRGREISQECAVGELIAFNRIWKGIPDFSHSAIYLGKFGGQDLMFHQQNTALPFSLSTFQDYLLGRDYGIHFFTLDIK